MPLRYAHGTSIHSRDLKTRYNGADSTHSNNTRLDAYCDILSMLFENGDSKQPAFEPQVGFSQNRVGVCFEQLRGEIISLLEHEAVSREAVKQLENELSVYKRAYAGLDAERQRFEQQIQESERKREVLENQLKGHRVIALIDGDGAIFACQLIAQGQSGGHTAAQKVSDAIVQYLNSTVGVNQYQLSVYVFFNKRGLMDTLGRAGFLAAKNKFEEFIIGFNQAAERFLMVDVGSAKEAADAKIKVLLEDEIRLPQTEKIIFGGCHDNGYATTLRSQITAGFTQKLILLRSYADMAAGINELGLPSFDIPDLFVPQKLLIPSPSQVNSTPDMHFAPRSASPTAGPSERSVGHRASISTIQGFDALPFASADLEEPTRKRVLLPPSYSSAVQTHAPPKRVVTPDLDPSGSTSSSDESEDAFSATPLVSLTNSRSRLVNPNIPLSKHKPPPCTLFYLSTCKHGGDCKYGHDYLLQPEHYNEIRVNAKKSPCPSRNKGEVCLWGDDCCYGHHCPSAAKCHFFKQGRCKFVGGDMHKEPKNQGGAMV